MTVSVSLGWMRYACASTVMPMNIVIAMTAIMAIVADAFFASGGLNAGTPLDTASTPVIAVQPFENAVSSRNIDNGAPVVLTRCAAVTGIAVPVIACQTPMPIKASIITTKK